MQQAVVDRQASFWSKAKLDDLDVHSTDPLEPSDEVERLFTLEGTMTLEESNMLEEVGKAIPNNNGEPAVVKMVPLYSVEEGISVVSVDQHLGEKKPSTSEASPTQSLYDAMKRKYGNIRRFKQDMPKKDINF